MYIVEVWQPLLTDSKMQRKLVSVHVLANSAMCASLFNDFDEDFNPNDGTENVTHFSNGLAANLLSQQVAQLCAGPNHSSICMSRRHMAADKRR